MTTTEQKRDLYLEYELAHRPEKVWRALTDPELLSQWLLPVFGFAPTAGTAFRFETEPKPGWDGVVNCHVLEVEEMRTLRLRWVVGELDTEVRFTLSTIESGTRLEIAHTGFTPEQKANRGGARYGWKMMSDRLIDLLGRIDG